MSASLLPKHFALRSRDNDKYLRYVHEAGQLQGYLHFSGNEVTSPYCRFESELSVSAPQKLVNIRCVFNNKYWVSNTASGQSIVATADKTNEDSSVEECTTLEPIRHGLSDRPNDFSFVRPRGGLKLWLRNEPANFRHNTLYAVNLSVYNWMEVVDLDSLVTFPTHLAFKGDNNLYLAARIIQSYEYLQFIESDSAAGAAAHQVFVTPHGQIRVRNSQWGKFWRRSPNWIWADSTDNTANNPDTLFAGLKLGDNVVALRNSGNNNFCRRLTLDGKTNCYNAAVASVINETRVTLTELVVSRRVFNVIYHLSNARIYGHHALMVGTGSVDNPVNVDSTLAVSFTHTSSTSTTWTAGISIMTGVAAEFTAGVPFIAGATITVSAEVTKTLEWGRTTTEENSIQVNYTINSVPPRTKAVVRMMATKATCDVPFSFTQTDILTNGQVETKTLENGIFKGVNDINVHYEVDFVPL